MPKLNNNFVGQIIEEFEEFLDERNIAVPNEDKAQDHEGASTIYGMDFADLMSRIVDVLNRWNIPYEDGWEN